MARTALVTGAGSGIGRAIARALVERGDTVVFSDVDGGSASTAAAEIGWGATSVTLDVRDFDAVDAAVRSIVQQHGRLDIIVNNAGVAVGDFVEELTGAHWERVIGVNLLGVIHGVRAAYPVMVAQGSGTIVNIASLAGLVPAPLLVPYATTKHAVVGLSTSLRLEAAGRGVHVMCVCPGYVDTPLLEMAAPPGLPEPTMYRYYRELVDGVPGRLYPAEKLARDVVRAIERDRGMVIAPGSARLVAGLERAMPAVVSAFGRWQVTRLRRRMAASRAAQPDARAPASWSADVVGSEP